MAYTNNDIAAKARELAGDISDESGRLLNVLCAAAEAELRSRLKNGAPSAELEEVFVTAAGMLAFAMLTETERAEDVSSFTAGSVSVTLRGSSVSAAALRRQAENMLRGYIDSGDFAFLGVQG